MPPINAADVINSLAYFGITKETIIPPLIIMGLFYLLIRKSVGDVKEDVDCTRLAIVEIQSGLKTKLKMSFDQSVNKYGQSRSPMVLKEEFKHFITDVGLDNQIKQKKDTLVTWLKNQKPKTGIDAQEDIYNLVVTKEIEKYLDLTKYKQNLYQKGKTSVDAEAILGIYLFEILIPVLFPEKKK